MFCQINYTTPDYANQNTVISALVCIPGKFPLSFFEEGACRKGSVTLDLRHHHISDTPDLCQSSAHSSASTVSSASKPTCIKPSEFLENSGTITGPPPYDEQGMDRYSASDDEDTMEHSSEQNEPHPMSTYEDPSTLPMYVYGGQGGQVPLMISPNARDDHYSARRTPSLPTIALPNSDQFLSTMTNPTTCNATPNGVLANDSSYHRSHSECFQCCLSREPRHSFSCGADLPTKVTHLGDTKPHGIVTIVRRKVKGATVAVKKVFSRKPQINSSTELTPTDYDSPKSLGFSSNHEEVEYQNSSDYSSNTLNAFHRCESILETVELPEPGDSCNWEDI